MAKIKPCFQNWQISTLRGGYFYPSGRYRLSGQQEDIRNHQIEHLITTHDEIQCFCEKTWKLSETISAQSSIEIWESVQFRGLWCLDSRSSIPKSFFMDDTGDTYCISGCFAGFRSVSRHFEKHPHPVPSHSVESFYLFDILELLK